MVNHFDQFYFIRKTAIKIGLKSREFVKASDIKYWPTLHIPYCNNIGKKLFLKLYTVQCTVCEIL